jgi:hypothetical protein
MPKRTVGIAIVVTAALIAVWALFFRGSEEDRVRAAIMKAASVVKVVSGENPIVRAARVKGDLVEVVEKDVSYTVPDLPGEGVGKGRDPLIAAAVSIASVYEEAEVTVAFGDVTIEPSGKGAAATTTVTLSAQRGGRRERDVRKVSFALRKDGEWKIAELTVYPKE